MQSRHAGGPALRALGALVVGMSALIASTAVPHAERSAGPGSLPAGAPKVSLLVRTGDAVPGQARIGDSWSFARLSGDRLIFVTQDGALMLRESGHTRILLHIGETVPDCGNLWHIYNVVAGGDGSVASAIRCDESAAIVRIDPGGGPPVTILRTGMTLPGLSVPIRHVWGPAIDGLGRITANVEVVPDSALVRQAKGEAPVVLLKPGDPLGPGTFQQALEEPAVNTAGRIAFRARLADGQEAVATLLPGEAPELLVSLPAAENSRRHFAGAALNDAGVVAFLRALHWNAYGIPDSVVVERAEGGSVATIAAVGDPAPEGGSLADFSWTAPAVEASGGVLFAAVGNGWNFGLYRALDGVVSLVAGSSEPLGNNMLVTYGGGGPPLVTEDGSVLFNGLLYSTSSYLGRALFAEHSGVFSIETRMGETLDEPARITMLSAASPSGHQAAGPSVARDGTVLFNASTTGRYPGLYARRSDGTLAAVALDGDEAPGGGVFDGWAFAFHTMATGGRFAFVGSIRTTGSYPYPRRLVTGTIGGPLTRIVAEGEAFDGGTIGELLPPSRVDANGVIVIPVVLLDGRSFLLRWNGTALEVLARSGDPLPDGGTIEAIRTGSTDAPLAPLLGDDGSVWFGVVTGGRNALYRLPPGGALASATRVIGDGAVVTGTLLHPLELRALSLDIAGRLAFQAVTLPDSLIGTWLMSTGAPTARVAGPGETMPEGGQVVQATPRLAATSGGIVHETQTIGLSTERVLWLATPSASGTPAFDQLPLNLGGTPAPGGGTFRGGYGFTPWPSGALPTLADRVGSDGDRLVVSVEETTQGAQILTLFDLRPDVTPPIAAAGTDLVVECSGPQGTPVSLDGSGSVDPGQGGLSYAWSTPFGTATGRNPSILVPLGRWVVSLKVTNAQGLSSEDSVMVTVRDKTAPSIAVQATPDTLGPAEGLVPVEFALTMQDVCDPAPVARLLSVTVNDRSTSAHNVVGADFGTDDRSIALRAPRTGRGRTYTVTYQVSDASRNRVRGTATVTAPGRATR